MILRIFIFLRIPEISSMFAFCSRAFFAICQSPEIALIAQKTKWQLFLNMFVPLRAVPKGSSNEYKHAQEETNTKTKTKTKIGCSFPKLMGTKNIDEGMELKRCHGAPSYSAASQPELGLL